MGSIQVKLQILNIYKIKNKITAKNVNSCNYRITENVFSFSDFLIKHTWKTNQDKNVKHN